MWTTNVFEPSKRLQRPLVAGCSALPPPPHRNQTMFCQSFDFSFNSFQFPSIYWSEAQPLGGAIISQTPKVVSRLFLSILRLFSSFLFFLVFFHLFPFSRLSTFLPHLFLFLSFFLTLSPFIPLTPPYLFILGTFLSLVFLHFPFFAV